MGQTDWVTSRRTTWGLAVLTVLGLGSYAISVVPGVRSAPGFNPLIDGWLQGSSYVLLALVAVRSLADPAHRGIRGALVAAVVVRAAGFVLYLAVVRRSLQPAYPLIADAAWLTSSVLLVVALAYVAYRLSPRASVTLVLDAVVGALITAGIVVSLLFETFVALADPSLARSAVVTNLAYPLLDVALLIVVTGMLVVVRGRASASCVAMAVGAVGLAIVDCVYFYQLVNGSSGPGSPLAAFSLAATALLAWASPWLVPRVRPDSSDHVRGLATPAVLATAGLVVLFIDAVRGAPLLGLILVTTGILVAIARALLTRQQDAGVATDAIEEKQLELERFKALVEASADFVAIATHDGAILYVNPHGREMVGLDPGLDVTTTTVADYLEPADWEEWKSERRPAMYEQGGWRGEQHLRHWGGGTPIPVASSSFLIRHPRTGEPWLLATVQRDISDRLAQQAQVQRLADERQVLLTHLVEAQEDERSRIAAEVHDDAVQALSAVELRLHVLRKALAHESSEVLGSVEPLQFAVRGATDRLRHLLFDLESPARQTDLATALQEAAAYVLEDSVRWRVEAPGRPDLPVAARVIAYRIAKEALVNVRKHADASRVAVRIASVDGGVEVTIEDDGRGFDTDVAADRPGHLGLRGMRDRAAVASGTVRVSSTQGVGTNVRIWLPGVVDPEGAADGPR